MSGLEILQLCADRGVAPGSTKGAALHLRGIAAGFSELGHNVTTFTERRPEGPFPTEVGWIEELRGLRRVSADVIYERYSLGHLRGLELARDSKVPFVLEVNAPLVDEATTHRPNTLGRRDRHIERELLGAADLVITVSHELTRWVRRHRSGPTVTVTNGFDPAWFTRPPKPQKEPTLVFLGHPKPWHGADRLPGLVAALADAGRSVRMLVIGAGDGAEHVIDVARTLGVADRITVTGAQAPQQAAAWLTTATIGLAPYPRIEPFYFCPLKVVDYLAAGLPIVSTRQGDIPSLVGNAGITVDPDDTDAFVSAIMTLLDAPSAAAAMGRAGRARAMATLRWRDAAERTIAAIEGLRPLEMTA